MSNLPGYCMGWSAHRLHCVQVTWVQHVVICCSVQAELDRFCNAMLAIREEIREIEDGKAEK